jgi:hypothetical protein
MKNIHLQAFGQLIKFTKAVIDYFSAFEGL